MATVSSESSQPLAVGTWAGDGETASKSERYLAKRLAAAGADYKGVALATFLLAAGVIALGWIALGVVAEHWIVPGGLPRWARWAWLGAGLAALAAGMARWVLPLIVYRVNLVYAARTIEREFPELHNDLVNAVLVKPDDEVASQRMVRSLKRRAAKRLSGVPLDEAVVDRTVTVRLAGAVAALVAAACLYEVLAPKSMLTTAARLLAPWTSVEAPSRVKISGMRLHWQMPGDARGKAGDAAAGHEVKIDGGTATIIRGRQIVVAADLRGLRVDEPVMLVVRPLRDDGGSHAEARPWQVSMSRGGATGPFLAVLPDASRGLDHSLDFVIAAGDGRTEPVKVVAVDAPSLLVREVRYEYPAYTRQAAEVTRWQGDIRAVEGTTVTVVAAGNRPIGGGWIDFDCDGKRDQPLKVSAGDPAEGTASFGLALDDTGGPRHASYRLIFQPRDGSLADGGLFTGDLQHRIDVLPDVAPEIAIEEPTESPLRVPPDAPVRVRVRAVDPDFGLARVGIEVRLKNGPARPEIVLLAQEKTGPFTGTTRLVPRQLGAEPGATLEYRGVATDTRPGRPNVSRTQWQALIVDASARPREPGPAGDDRGKPTEKPRPQPDAGEGKSQGDAGSEGSPNEGGQRDGENQPSMKPGAVEQDPAKQDGSSDPTQAGDKAANAGGQQDATSPNETRQTGGQQPGQSPPSGNEANGKQSAGTSAGQEQGGEKQGRDANGNGEKQPEGRQQGQAGEKAAGARQGGGQENAGQQSGNQQSGNQQGTTQGKPQGKAGQQGSDPKGGAQQRAGEQTGEPQEGQRQGGDQQSEQRSRDAVAADGTNDGEAMERILEQRRREQEERREGGQPACAGADGKPCGKQGCSSCGGGQQGGQQGGAGEQSGREAGQKGLASGREDGSEGGQAGSQNEPGDGAAANAAKGGGPSADPATDPATNKQGGAAEQDGGSEGSQKPAGDEQQSASDAGPSARPGVGKPGDGKPGDGKPGEGKPGEGKQGQSQQGEGKQGEGKQGEGSATGDGALSGGESTPRMNRPAVGGEQERRELEWGDENLAHARNAADLAVEHLRDSIAAGRSDVLDALGWTPQQAQAFIERWQALRRMAGSDDPARRGEFERAVRSLGLRPGGVRSSRDVPADVKGGQAEGRRSRPPSEYREQVRAFLQGTSAE